MDVHKLKSLKETHPQKYYLKLICRYIYYMGLGDCWYEKTERSRRHRILYVIWAVIFNGYVFLNTLNEVLANIRTDLNVKEKNDLIQFTFAHPCLVAKFTLLIFQKDRIRVLFKRMMEETRSIYSSPHVDKASVKKGILYAMWIAIVSYGTIFLGLMDGIKTHYSSDIPIRTEVVLFPTRSNTGVFVNIIRFLVECHWWFIVTNMLLVDSLSVFALTYLGYKFKLVRMYFEHLGKKTVNSIGTKDKSVLSEEFEKDFKTGIMLHEDALWCARNVQYALGNLYSVQVFETMTLLVMCLVRLVTNERNLIFLLSILAYIICLFVLTGAYFTAAGDITYQASKVCTSIFHSGWEMMPASRSLRSMAVVAIQRSQVPVYMTAFGVITLSHSNYISLAVVAIQCSEVPVYMTAFGVITLSHSNYISVMRSSYSFFAVLY